jgi:hypothetical protein
MQAFSGDTHSDLEGFRDLIGSASNGCYRASGPQKNSSEPCRRGCHWSQLVSLGPRRPRCGAARGTSVVLHQEEEAQRFRPL